MDSSSQTLIQGVSSLTDLLHRRAAEASDKGKYIFLKDDGGDIGATYGELDRKARAVAARLVENTSPGDRVLLLYPPGIDFLAGFFGCLYAKLIGAPLPLPGSRGGLRSSRWCGRIPELNWLSRPRR